MMDSSQLETFYCLKSDLKEKTAKNEAYIKWKTIKSCSRK